MSFQNVTWNENESITSQKIQKMIDNDQLNYSLLARAPRGYLAGVNIEDLASANRTLNQTSSQVSKTLLSFSLNSKDTKLNANEFYRNRYLKVCVSEINMSDATTTDRFTSGAFINRPNQRAFSFIFRFIRSGYVAELPSVIATAVAKPARFTTSGVNSPSVYRTQAFEFIYPIIFEPSEGIRFQVDMKKILGSVTTQSSTNNTYTLTSGNIWIEDVGGSAEKFNLRPSLIDYGAEGVVYPA